MMKAHFKLLLCLTAMLPAFAFGQELTRQQAGRAAVAQCYAECIDHFDENRQSSDAVYFQQAEFTYRILHDVTGDPRFAVEQSFPLLDTLTCRSAQRDFWSMDSCRLTCFDISVAHGGISTYAYPAFNDRYQTIRSQLTSSGLWAGNYANSPKSGPAFEAACNRYQGNENTKANGLLPKLGSQ